MLNWLRIAHRSDLRYCNTVLLQAGPGQLKMDLLGTTARPLPPTPKPSTPSVGMVFNCNLSPRNKGFMREGKCCVDLSNKNTPTAEDMRPNFRYFEGPLTEKGSDNKRQKMRRAIKALLARV